MLLAMSCSARRLANSCIRPRPSSATSAACNTTIATRTKCISRSPLLTRLVVRVDVSYTTGSSRSPSASLLQVDLSRLVNARAFSSSSGSDGYGRKSRNGKGGFKLDALSFKVSPDEALAEFNKWVTEVQGLRYLLNWKNVKISAAYAPVWSFDVNIRFVTRTATGQKKYDLKPEPFAVYRNTDTVHVPGLSAYSGYEYRRSLINPVHNTTLVFMGDKTVPFGSWMLRDMKTRSGMTLPIYPGESNFCF